MRNLATFSACLLFALIAASMTARAQLKMDILPVYVTDGEGAWPPADALDRAFQNARSALEILGVQPWEYDLVHSRQRESLTCTSATPHNATSCTHKTHGAISNMENLGLTLNGGSRNSYVHQGTARLIVLLLPDGFSWGNTRYGVNSWWSWAGWEPDDLHYKTTSCLTWTNNWTYLMAHEIGHCFGLYHGGTGAWDRNYDGDDTMDLMSLNAHFYVTHLRPSNAARVRHHFRSLNVQTEE